MENPYLRINEIKNKRRKEFAKILDRYLKLGEENPKRHYPIHTDKTLSLKKRK